MGLLKLRMEKWVLVYVRLPDTIHNVNRKMTAREIKFMAVIFCALNQDVDNIFMWLKLFIICYNLIVNEKPAVENNDI